MGKTIKCKDKAAKKIAKAKAKVERKARRGVAAIVAAFALAALFTGCATSDSAQPAKSQTQNNTFDDCIIIVATQASMSNRIVKADGTKDIPAVELFTQTQSLESSGTESYAQTATQTPTTDVKPDIDVHYNDALKNATDASKGVLETLLSSSANKVLGLMASKESGTVQVTKKDGTTATVECKDGQCSIVSACPDGKCADRACADGKCTDGCGCKK